MCVSARVCIHRHVCPRRSHEKFWLCVILEAAVDAKRQFALSRNSRLCRPRRYITRHHNVYETHDPSVRSLKSRGFFSQRSPPTERISSSCGFFCQRRRAYWEGVTENPNLFTVIVKKTPLLILWLLFHIPWYFHSKRSDYKRSFKEKTSLRFVQYVPLEQTVTCQWEARVHNVSPFPALLRIWLFLPTLIWKRTNCKHSFLDTEEISFLIYSFFYNRLLEVVAVSVRWPLAG